MNRSHLPLVAGITIILALSSLPATGVEGADFSKGDVWNYTVADQYQNVSLNGTLKVSYIGISTITVNATDFRVYVFDFNTSLTGHGIGVDISVHSSDRAYYTLSNVNLVKDDDDTVYQERDQATGLVSCSLQIHNITTTFPPDGYGSWPNSVSVGDSWTVAYPDSSTQTVLENGNLSNSSEFYNESITYKYVGTETVRVPAGTFDCTVLDMSTTEWTQTTKSSEIAGMQVSAEERSSGGETTIWMLSSYDYSRGMSRDPLPFYALGMGAAVAGVAIVVLLLMRRRRGQKPSLDEQERLAVPTAEIPSDTWPPYR